MITSWYPGPDKESVEEQVAREQGLVSALELALARLKVLSADGDWWDFPAFAEDVLDAGNNYFGVVFCANGNCSVLTFDAAAGDCPNCGSRPDTDRQSSPGGLANHLREVFRPPLS